MKKCILFSIILFSSLAIPQIKPLGISLHSNIFTLNYPINDIMTTPELGHFSLGGKYNWALNDDINLNTGMDIRAFQIEESKKNAILRVFIFDFLFGTEYKIDQFSLLLDVGISYAQNLTNSDWGGLLDSAKTAFIFPVNIGLKYKIDDPLSAYFSLTQNFTNLSPGNFDILSVNIGLSYNLFDSKAPDIPPTPPDSTDPDPDITKYRDSINIIRDSLTAHEEVIENLISVNESLSARISSPEILNINQINQENNLQLYENYSIEDFIENNKLTEKGEIILNEYNSFAEDFTFSNGQKGLHLICYIPSKYVDKFPPLGNISIEPSSYSKDKVIFELDFQNMINSKDFNIILKNN